MRAYQQSCSHLCSTALCASLLVWNAVAHATGFEQNCASQSSSATVSIAASYPSLPWGRLLSFSLHLASLPGCKVHYKNRVTDIVREANGRWRVEVHNLDSGDKRSVKTKFVFIGAGGGALPLLQKSGLLTDLLQEVFGSFL